MRTPLLCLTTVLIAGSVAYGRNIAWNPKTRPPLSLEQALARAEKSLDAQRKGFYCIGAHLGITRSRAGDWTFTFASQRGDHRTVVVHLDSEKVEVHQKPLDY